MYAEGLILGNVKNLCGTVAVNRSVGSAGPVYNLSMNTSAIVETIDEQIARLEHVRALLTGTTASAPLTVKYKPRKTSRRKMSAESRARIAAAQRARWAKTRRK